MDAYRILARAGDGFDWDRLVQEARSRQLTLPVREGLASMRQDMAIVVPVAVQQALRTTPVSLTERLAFNAQSVKPGAFGKLYRDVVDYALRSRRRPLGERLIGLVWYEKAVLRVGALWHVPFRLAFLAGRRGSRAVKARLSKA